MSARSLQTIASTRVDVLFAENPPPPSRLQFVMPSRHSCKSMFFPIPTEVWERFQFDMRRRIIEDFLTSNDLNPGEAKAIASSWYE